MLHPDSNETADSEGSRHRGDSEPYHQLRFQDQLKSLSIKRTYSWASAPAGYKKKAAHCKHKYAMGISETSIEILKYALQR